MTTTINHLDDKFLFGKFQGEALGDVLMYAPDYLTWVIKNVDGNRFVLMDSAVEEIKEIFPSFSMDIDFEKNRQRQLNDYHGVIDTEYDYYEEACDEPTLKDVLINDGGLGSTKSNSCDLLFLLESHSTKVFNDIRPSYDYSEEIIEEIIGKEIETSNRIFWRLVGYFNLDDFIRKGTNIFRELTNPLNRYKIKRTLGYSEINICRNLATFKDSKWQGLTIFNPFPIYREVCLCKSPIYIDVVRLITPSLESHSLYHRIKREGVNYIVSESEWTQNNWPPEYSFMDGKIVLRVNEGDILFKDKYGYIKSVGNEAIAILCLSDLYDSCHYLITNDLEHVYLSNIPVSKIYELDED